MIIVNALESAVISATDRALAYGDGVFRTLPVRGGIARHWALHYGKLAADCAAIGIACPTAQLLWGELRRASDDTPDCAIKVIVSRGCGERGYRADPANSPTRIVMSSPLPSYPAAFSEAGVTIRRCSIRLAHQPALAGLKHLNRLENVLARMEWDDLRIAEGLLLDADDNVIGGTMTNLFISTKGVLVTPMLDRCGVAGVTRDRVLRGAAQGAITCHVRNISWSDVLGADEIILVNSIAGAWPVREIEGAARTPGPVVRAVQQWLRHDDAPIG
jgi:4-amino-4-deoxychorismate lyase